MNWFLEQALARSIAHNSTGSLPAHGERVQIVTAKSKSVRVLASAFYFQGRVPKVGDIISIPGDEAAGLVQRKLAELV